MWKGYYGKEPFDLRLTALRVFARLPVIIAVTVLGSLLFGGGYYVKNVLLRGESQYAVTSRFRIEYAVDEEKDVGTVYINEVSWNTYLQTDLVLDAVRKYMTEVPERPQDSFGAVNERLPEGSSDESALWMEADGAFSGEVMKAVLASRRSITTTAPSPSP